MASVSGNKIIRDAVGAVVLLGLGAILVTHRDQALALAGVHLPGHQTERKASADADDGIMHSHGGSRSVELQAAGNGHFVAEAEINGSHIDVLVDTGASAVALTYEDARRAGIQPLDTEFTGRVQTANGVARVAPVVIDRISIGDFEVRNVKGFVSEDGALATSLLGMTFLSRLSVSMRQGRLVLED